MSMVNFDDYDSVKEQLLSEDDQLSEPTNCGCE
jgi:hypothetical protein